ncbi:MAG: TPM domain-containing protein [Bacteroidales bacterium]|nr:TPM domain-containing protein [Bacteroidales bacterium]
MQLLKYIFVLFSITIISYSGFSQDIPEKPEQQRLVNDFANFLSSEEIQSLENKLLQFNNETSTQIVIVVVKSLNNYEKADFTIRLAEKWGVGQKGLDNGIVIMVKPKTNTEKGEVFISTGYGLEGVVPDAIAKRIVNNDILPSFKEGRYYSGLNKATNTLISLTKGEFTAKQYKERTKQTSSPFGPFIVIFIIIIFSFIGKMRRARHYSLGHNVSFWVAMSMIGSMGRSSGSSFSSFSSGGGSFGGFGGGSFGGGGAGGSW